jgi:hypothetical protein
MLRGGFKPPSARRERAVIGRYTSGAHGRDWIRTSGRCIQGTDVRADYITRPECSLKDSNPLLRIESPLCFRYTKGAQGTSCTCIAPTYQAALHTV